MLHLSEDDASLAWKDAVSLMKEGHYNTAIAIFTRLSEEGFIEATKMVAHLYEHGPGELPADLNEAERWYAMVAAEEANAQNRFDLARIILRQYRHAVGDEAKAKIEYAIKLLADLVEEGDVYAALYLGDMYFHGSAVPKDLSIAEVLLKKAAKRDFVIAILQLSRICQTTGRFERALALKIKAFYKFFLIFLRNFNDERLYLMHKGVGRVDEKWPDWPDGDWPRFSNPPER